MLLSVIIKLNQYGYYDIMTKESSGFNIWNERDLGIDTTKAQSFDSVSDSDIEYYCNFSYPYIQLINTNAVFAENMSLNFIQASTGWVICDYGEAISTALPHSLEQKKNISGVTAQAKTAKEIADLITTKGWTSIEIITGTAIMKRFIWIESKRAQFDLSGYTPNTNDEKCYDRLSKYKY